MVDDSSRNMFVAATDEMEHGFQLMQERFHCMVRFMLHRFKAPDARYAEHEKSVQKQPENHPLATGQQIITLADKVVLRFEAMNQCFLI